MILLWRWNINFDSGRLETKYRKPSAIIGVNTYLLKGFTIYKETLEGKKWRMSKIPFKSKQFLSLSCLIRNNNTLPKQVITMELTIRSSGFTLFLELSMQNQTLLFSPLRKNLKPEQTQNLTKTNKDILIVFLLIARILNFTQKMFEKIYVHYNRFIICGWYLIFHVTTCNVVKIDIYSIIIHWSVGTQKTISFFDSLLQAYVYITLI